MILLGIAGYAGSGKSTVAKYLVEKYGFRDIALADPLKKACAEIFRFTDEQLYGSKKEEVDPFWGLTPRDVLQRFGTEAMRNNFGQDLWIRALRRRLDGALPNSRFVVSDARFPNEADAIHEWGGEMIRIERPGVAKMSHASETALDSYDKYALTVYNYGSVADLHRNIDYVVETGYLWPSSR